MTFFSEELFTSGSGKIFVFGSNTRGIHGAGAAKFALKHCGAVYGQGFGLQGNSFAIPTKDDNIRCLSLNDIAGFVRQFVYFAQQNTQFTFYVSAIGTGLAGYQDIQIAPMFAECPSNCVLPDKWRVINTDEINLLTSNT